MTNYFELGKTLLIFKNNVNSDEKLYIKGEIIDRKINDNYKFYDELYKYKVLGEDGIIYSDSIRNYNNNEFYLCTMEDYKDFLKNKKDLIKNNSLMYDLKSYLDYLEYSCFDQQITRNKENTLIL